jgi:hypothetical protein
MLNLTTALHALMMFRYSRGTSVLEAALSKNNFTYSRNLGSWNSSKCGPKFEGSSGLDEGAELNPVSAIQSRVRHHSFIEMYLV